MKLLLKDRLFSWMEILTEAVKFHGIIFAIRLFINALKVRLLFANKKECTVFGFKFVFLNVESAMGMIVEMFGLNEYFFLTKNKCPVIVDIGANVGDSMLYFKWLYPTAKILAFEPNPEAVKLLMRNIYLNNFKDIQVFPYALGNQDGEFTLYNDDSQTFVLGTHSKVFVEREIEKNSGTRQSVAVQVPVKKALNVQALQKVESIDLLKLDIEGAEFIVLKELEPILIKVQAVVLEYHLLTDGTNSVDGIVTLLKKNNFKVGIFGSYRNDNNFTNENIFFITASK